MKNPLSGFSFTGKKRSEKGPPPQETETTKKKVLQPNQHTRRQFFSALLLTGSVEIAKKRTGVKEPYASQFLTEGLLDGGYSLNGERFQFRHGRRKTDK